MLGEVGAVGSCAMSLATMTSGRFLRWNPACVLECDRGKVVRRAEVGATISLGDEAMMTGNGLHLGESSLVYGAVIQN